VLLYLLLRWFAVVLQVLECLKRLDEMVLEGEKVSLAETFHCVLYVVAYVLLVMHSLPFLLYLSLTANHLRHKAVDQFFVLLLHASLHLFLLRTRRVQQVLIALCFLEDLCD